jgi:hypothetical protein
MTRQTVTVTVTSKVVTKPVIEVVETVGTREGIPVRTVGDEFMTTVVEIEDGKAFTTATTIDDEDSVARPIRMWMPNGRNETMNGYERHLGLARRNTWRARPLIESYRKKNGD